MQSFQILQPNMLCCFPVSWLRLICCSINQNRVQKNQDSQQLQLLYPTFLRLGSVSKIGRNAAESVSELSTLRTLYSSKKVPKCQAIMIIVSSIACIKENSPSMSFDSKIRNCSGFTSSQT